MKTGRYERLHVVGPAEAGHYDRLHAWVRRCLHAERTSARAVEPFSGGADPGTTNAQR